MFIASAENVVDMMLRPAIPGTMTSRSLWLFEKIAPKSDRKMSGRRKLKNAALGLRQNILRSRRYWRQERPSAPFIARTSVPLADGRRSSNGAQSSRRLPLGGHPGGELEIDILKRRPGDAEIHEPDAACERRARELVQQRRRVVGLTRDHRAVLVAPAHAVARRGVDAELRRRADGEDAPARDDRDAVAQRLRLVEVVRREQDRL